MLSTKSRKGISTFIATLLLILLAVAGGVVIYAYTMGYLGGLGGTTQTGTMSVDSSTGSTTAVVIYVRNVGKTSIVLDKVYQDGGEGASAKLSLPTSIAEGATGTVTITDTFTSGKTYTFKLVAKDGAQLPVTVTIK